MPGGNTRVLVVPGSSLVGIEILRSLDLLPGFDVLGAGTDVLAGRAAGFGEYYALPRVDDGGFMPALVDLVARERVDFVYPANDLAIGATVGVEGVGAVVVGHPLETIRVAGSKIATHERFVAHDIVPRRVGSIAEIGGFPVFSKPDVGHSSIGAITVPDRATLDALVAEDERFWETHLVTEVLLRDEVTVDCFSTSAQGLLFWAARRREEAEGGVSVVTSDYHDDELGNLARVIGAALDLDGPWFFQAKRDVAGTFRLMEIGARLAGASRIRRAQGVNLAQLAILAAGGAALRVYRSPFDLTSRAHEGRQTLECAHPFGALYIDLDDTLLHDGIISGPVAELARVVRERGYPCAIITRHRGNPWDTLARLGFADAFDDIFHLAEHESKADYIPPGRNSVLIDDSFRERMSCETRPDVLAVDASAAPLLEGLFR